jgi:hypothetical protein
VGLLHNPDEIGYAFHWAGIQLGKHGGKRSGVAKAMPDKQLMGKEAAGLQTIFINSAGGRILIFS